MYQFQSIIGALGHRLSTPAPIVLLDVLDENIHRMQTFANEHQKLLRPHVKTHKCVEIARRQLAAGAVGITAGTIGEAEAFADAGFEDIFIAYPIWPSPAKERRLKRLAQTVELRIGAESRPALGALSQALGNDAFRVGIVIEIDCGARRSGVRAEEVGPLAKYAQTLGLRIDGVFTYPGHGGKIGAREGAAADQGKALSLAVESLLEVGIKAEVVSAGSSPTAKFSTEDVITEIRPGEYCLNDFDNYRIENCESENIGFFVASTVVSDQNHEHVILDAGTKALAREGDAQRGWGQVPEFEGVISSLNEYHGFLRLPAEERRPEVGSVIPIVPHHVCPVINSFDRLILSDRHGRYLGTWDVDARGRLN